MATQDTEKILGGTSAKRYADPYVTNRPNEFGLYQWSTFRATVCWFNEEGTLAPLTDAAQSITGLLFVSDLPAILNYCGTIGGINAAGRAYNVLQTNVLNDVAGPSGAYVVLPSFGKVASGYSGANYNSVYVTGFPFDGVTSNSDDCYFLDCIANSPNICAPIGAAWVGTGNTATPVGKGSSPILLQCSQYTQAIKDNDNIIEQGGYSYVVVGLCRVGG
jgi:hypothetical protein